MGWGTRANPAAGAFGGTPNGATKRVKGAMKLAGERMRTLPQERSELPGATKRERVRRIYLGTHAKPCRRSLRWSPPRGHEAFEGGAETGRGTHGNPTTGTLGGAPYEATKLVRGTAKLAGGRMRTLPQEPSVEFPMGPRSGHETCEGCAEHWLWGVCEPCRGSFRRSSLWGNETCEGCAEMGWGTHANPPTGAQDGAPCGARSV